MNPRNTLIVALGLGALALAVTLLNTYDLILLSPLVTAGLRWSALAALAVYTAQRRHLTAWIFFAMLLGAELGTDVPQIADGLRVMSKIFLKLIKTIIGPLLFGTLVVGIAGHSNLKQVGRMGWKSLLYFEVATTFALFIGLAAINLSRAGDGIPAPTGSAAEEIPKVPARSAADIILHTFPDNIAKAVADGETLQIVVFSVIFGIGLALVAQSRRGPMLSFAESLSEVMFKFTDIVMLFAPFAVCGAVAFTVAHMGLGVFKNLFILLATLYLALIAFVLLVLLPVALVIRLPLRQFLRALSEPVSIAFATASSEAALPRALEAMEKFGVPRKVVAFVLPTGYSFNLDGSTLYLALATVFIAQAAGIELSIGQQLIICLTLMLSSKGVAGVPRGTLVIIMGTLSMFGLPEWPAAVILGIDQLMDMARTAVNVTGNCLASCVVARWEGEFDDAKALAFTTEPGTLKEIKD